MKMVSMKMSKSLKNESMALTVAGGPEQEYPYGLTLSLNTDSLKKLGMDELPAVGAGCIVHGLGKVTRVGESASENDKDQNVEIQITRLSITPHDDGHDDDGHDDLKKGYAKGRGPKVCE